MVNYYFEQWKKDGTFEEVNQSLNADDRVRQGREPCPSLLCVDSQSVRLAPLIFEKRGRDAFKMVNGRKRHFAVDTGGRVWTARVGPANAHDGQEGCVLLAEQAWWMHRPGGCTGLVDAPAWWMHRLEKILGDGSYLGQFAEHARNIGLVFERASRPESARGFVPVAFRRSPSAGWSKGRFRGRISSGVW